MFEFKEHRRNVPEVELLEDIRKVAQKLGKPFLTRSQYEEHGTFGFTTFVRRFGKWSEALKQANIEVKTPIYNSNEDLFSNLANVWTRLGRQPRYKELTKDISKFSSGTYENRFGSWNNALKAFIEFIEGKISDDSHPEQTQRFATQRKTPRNINWRLRAKILIRDNCICQMCGTSPAKDKDVILHVDHIKPWSKGGETLEENLRTLCHKCNIGKSDIDVTED